MSEERTDYCGPAATSGRASFPCHVLCWKFCDLSAVMTLWAEALSRRLAEASGIHRLIHSGAAKTLRRARQGFPPAPSLPPVAARLSS